ncbi:MAG: hypothetical protein WKI04_10335 [Ferruginibacter sp.]
MKEILYNDAVSLLKQLIATPSYSREENITAGILSAYFETKGVEHGRLGNNGMQNKEL